MSGPRRTPALTTEKDLRDSLPEQGRSVLDRTIPNCARCGEPLYESSVETPGGRVHDYDCAPMARSPKPSLSLHQANPLVPLSAEQLIQVEGTVRQFASLLLLADDALKTRIADPSSGRHMTIAEIHEMALIVHHLAAGLRIR